MKSSKTLIIILIILKLIYKFRYNKVVSKEKFHQGKDLSMYCINLLQSSKRYNDIINKFSKIKKYNKTNRNIKLKRFNAVYGKELKEIPTNLIKLNYNTDFNAKCDGNCKQGRDLKLSGGEIGCGLSHYYLWKKIIEENLDHAIVIEDDLSPLNSFYEIFTQINKLEMITKEWDIIYISFLNTGNKQYLTKNIFIPKCGFSTSGYIISKNGAKKLLNYLPIEGPIDVHLCNLFYHNKINAYVFENICDVNGTWGGYDSLIEHTK